MSEYVKVKTGDVVMYNNYKVQVIDTNTNNGVGIIYLEGPKKNWEDWVMNLRTFFPIESETIEE